MSSENNMKNAGFKVPSLDSMGGDDTLNYNQAQPTQNYNQAPPTQNYNQAPPTQNYNQAPPTQNYNQAPPTQNYDQVPPVQNYNQVPPVQNYNQVTPVQTVYSQVTPPPKKRNVGLIVAICIVSLAIIGVGVFIAITLLGDDSDVGTRDDSSSSSSKDDDSKSGSKSDDDKDSSDDDEDDDDDEDEEDDDADNDEENDEDNDEDDVEANSAEDAARQFLEAYTESHDADAAVNATSDSLYAKCYDYYSQQSDYFENEEISQMYGDVHDGETFKEYTKNIIGGGFEELEEGEDDGLSYSIISEEEIGKDEIADYCYSEDSSGDIEYFGAKEEYLDALFDDYTEFIAVKVQMTMEDESVEYWDICYKEDGRWYSSYLVFATSSAIIRYEWKSATADDVASAETINTACSAALANEDAYSEVMDAMDGGVIATAKPGEAFYLVRSDGIENSAETFLDEVNTGIGGTAPNLEYTDDGACYWSIAISSSGKPVVYISTSEGGTTWELQPEIDDSYK